MWVGEQEGINRWPPVSIIEIFIELEDMTFKKPAHHRGKGKMLDTNKIVEPEVILEALPANNKFISTLKKEIPECVLFLPGKLRNHPTKESQPPEIICVDHGSEAQTSKQCRTVETRT